MSAGVHTGDLAGPGPHRFHHADLADLLVEQRIEHMITRKALTNTASSPRIIIIDPRAAVISDAKCLPGYKIRIKYTCRPLASILSPTASATSRTCFSFLLSSFTVIYTLLKSRLSPSQTSVSGFV